MRVISFSGLGPTTFAQLEAVATQSAIRAAVRAGRLRSPTRGVYVGADRDLTTADRVGVAQLAIGRDLPAAFHTAAELHGFGVIDDGRTHLVGPESKDHSPRRNLVVHSSAIEPALIECSGVLTVTPERSAIDLARTLDAMDGVAVLDAALRKGLPKDALAMEMVQHAGLRGIRRARLLLDFADPLAESPQESRLRLISIAGGLPTPTCQIPVLDGRGHPRYRLDLGWEQLKVAAEYDGGHHGGQEYLRRDRTRQNWLTNTGWRLLFFTDVDVYRQQMGIVLRIRDELRTAAQILGLPDPARRLMPIKELWPRLKIN